MSYRRLVVPIAIYAIAFISFSEATAQNAIQAPIPSGSSALEAGPTDTVTPTDGETIQDAWAVALSVDPDLEASRWLRKTYSLLDGRQEWCHVGLQVSASIIVARWHTFAQQPGV